MLMTRKSIAIIVVLLSVIILGATSRWIYVTYNFIEFVPLSLDEKKELVPAEIAPDFYKNLRLVLDSEHVKYRLDILDHPLVQLKVAQNKQLIWRLTEKAQDIVWLYDHKHEQRLSFPCKGEEYSGFVFKKQYPADWWGKGTVDTVLTCEDIMLAEKILKTSRGKTAGNSNWRLNLNFSKYYRQYFGYRNAKGDVCVHIEFTLKPACISRLQDDMLGIKDGGTANWNLEINLNNKTVKGL